MPRDANGNYTLPAGNPVVSGTVIQSIWANTTMPDLGSEMTDSLSRSGQGGMLVSFRIVDGTVGSPAYSFTNEITLGWYRPEAGVMAFVAAGVETARVKVDGNIAVVGAAPVEDEDLTRKDYVDTAVGPVADKVNRSGDQMTGQLGGVAPGPVAPEDLTRMDYVDAADLFLQGEIDAIDPAADFDAKLEGYATGGLHKEFTGDLDTIAVDSKYYITIANVTNFPADMVADGVIETDMTDTGVNDAVQLITTMDAASEGAAFIRNLDGGVWSEWFPFGAGGAATTISPTPPVDPEIGDSWWDSDLGRAFVYYDDGDSIQWVEEDPTQTPVPVVTSIGATTQFPNGASAPWLLCDGQAVSRTSYPDLFAYLGVVYGNGDGSTTFNVPDYRGKFLRGTDRGAGVDPDAAGRTARGDGVTGDNVGTEQADELAQHNHGFAIEQSTGEAGTIRSLPFTTGVSNQNTKNTGGNETRPVNVYTDWYILSDVAATVVDNIAGTVVQVQEFETNALVLGTGIIPQDNTIPQITEGSEFMSLAFTPKYASSKLMIEVNTNISIYNIAAGNMVAHCIFEEGVPDALKVSTTVTDTSLFNFPAVTVRHFVSAVDVAARTYKYRCGVGLPNSMSLNAFEGVARFGGVNTSSITITEIAQ